MKLNNKGQSIVETALILPIILLLIMGMFEFGRVFSSYLLVTYTSRESARMAAVGRTDSEILQNIQDRSGLLDLSHLQVVINPPQSARATGDQVSVTIRYQITIYAPIIQTLLPNPYQLQSTTFMRVE